MNRRRNLLLLGCWLCLLAGLRTADGSVLESGADRDNRQHRAVRRSDGGSDRVEDRTNAIDQPLDLQFKYYDVVQVDLVGSLPTPSGSVSLVAAGAGEGQTPDKDPSMPASPKPEAAKTLADQVAEGKYGLIHRELFQRRPQRLGVLNYRRNEEVPLDDERNLGGLRPDEIWLAEDHLLVLKGGSISFGANRTEPAPWQPIDDYRAPDRQVQIPANPAVPPPFPVQLREDGPIEFIRGRQVPAFNPFTNESAFLFTNKAFPVIRPEDLGGQNLLAGPAPLNASGLHHPGLQYPAPVNPPALTDNRTYSNPFLKLPPLGVTSGSLDDVRGANRTGSGPFPGPPGPPPGDEDDPSLYYPPPYTFEYRGNYSNPVPPGPLVPGIILPPPPNFFILKPNATERPKAAKPSKAPKPPKAAPTTTTARPYPSTAAAPPAKITPSRVEIQKAVLKTFVPVLEVYGAPPAKPAPVPTKRPPRPKPTVPAAATTPLLTPSTKLHKIPPEGAHPIYAEYFDIRTSTAAPAWPGDAGSSPAPVTPHLPRTYLPVAAKPRPASPPPSNEYLPAGGPYGLSPIEQFHREVQTIRQTLQIYEKANKLTKAGRTSKARPVANLSLSFDGNVYRTLFPEELPAPAPAPGPSHYQRPAYDPAPPSYVYRPSVGGGSLPQDLPGGYYVTTTDYGRHGSPPAHYYQPAPAPPPPPPPPPPHQPDLSYIAPVILNNGASGYNRRPEYDPGVAPPGTTTTTKSYLILDHRLPGPARYRAPLGDLPYLYRGAGGPAAPGSDPAAGAAPSRTRYLDGDILVNYKHPLPVLNPDSEFLPYHHRLKVRKRQNGRGAGEQKPRYHGQPLYNHR